MSPKVMISDETSFIMASLDGYDAMDGKRAVEIKCGGEKLHLQSIHGEIPKYYLAQMQHQMYVAELDEIYYCSYRPEHVVNPLYIEIIKRDDDFIGNMIEKETNFYFDYMLRKTPPPNPNAIKTIDSEVWKNLSNEYIRLDHVEKEASKRKDEIKDLLLQLSSMENAKGNGITLTKVERKGMINYQNIPILKTMDLEEYRKPGTSYWQVKESNEN
jgi:predicted phage-related endonuclease